MEESKEDIAAAKKAGGDGGRDSDVRIERIAAAVATRWRCWEAEDLA